MNAPYKLSTSSSDLVKLYKQSRSGLDLHWKESYEEERQEKAEGDIQLYFHQDRREKVPLSSPGGCWIKAISWSMLMLLTLLWRHERRVLHWFFYDCRVGFFFTRSCIHIASSFCSFCTQPCSFWRGRQEDSCLWQSPVLSIWNTLESQDYLDWKGHLNPQFKKSKPPCKVQGHVPLDRLLRAPPNVTWMFSGMGHP